MLPEGVLFCYVCSCTCLGRLFVGTHFTADLPVGESCSEGGGCGSDPCPGSGALGGSMLHGALGNWANSLPIADPINIIPGGEGTLYGTADECN
ncbi:hypothetical protein ZHAS_00017953 [Anopheles sinensis]|uniref:Uncharacterized protein n=1 Tax=Anopheles sinensis TaxID=74873 RepID=A0A084WI77_ANOSI|nr:hypothetical protein ZHAS_00017953 [Anopheles sinensis]